MGEGEEEVRVVIGVHRGGDDDGGEEAGDADADVPDHLRGHDDVAAIGHRLEAPVTEADQPHDGAGSDEGRTEVVAADPVGLVEHDDADHDAGRAAGEHWDAERVGVAAAARELHLGEGQDDQGDRQDDQDEEHAIALTPLVVVALPLAGEDRSPEVVAARLADVADLDLVDDQLREAELGADEDEEGTEGDDEARQGRAFDEHAVPVADRHREQERQRDRQPQVEAGAAALAHFERQHDDQDAHRTGHGAGGEVELATDHQHRHRNGHDAERRGREVDEAGSAAGGAERDGDRPEEDPEAEHADHGADLRSDEEALEDPAVRQALVGAGPVVGVVSGGVGRRCRGRVVGHARRTPSRVRHEDAVLRERSGGRPGWAGPRLGW